MVTDYGVWGDGEGDTQVLVSPVRVVALLSPLLGVAVHRLDGLARGEWRLAVGALVSTLQLSSVTSVCFGEVCEWKVESLLCSRGLWDWLVLLSLLVDWGWLMV